MKKTTLIVLTVVILMTIFVVPVWGEAYEPEHLSFTPEQYLKYVVWEDTEELGETVISIQGFAKDIYSRDITEIEIPSTINGIKVWHIAREAFRDCKNLTKVTIHENVGKIESYAFYGCTSLKTVELPNSLSSIHSYAFSETVIESIKLPGSLKYIDEYAFASCWNLKEVEFSDGIEYIGNYSFAYCEKLERISISNSVKTIGEGAFYGCRSLSGISFGNGVETIGKNAFAYCSLRQLTIPSSVTTIEESAFFGNGFHNIIIPSSVAKIERNAFALDYKPNQESGYSQTHVYCEFDLKPDGWDEDWDVLFEDVRLVPENIHWVGTPLPENIIESQESENTENVSEQDNTADEQNDKNNVLVYILSAVAVAEFIVIVLMTLKKSKK